MSSYDHYTVPELKKLIIDRDDFREKTGSLLSSAKRKQIVDYLAKMTGMDPGHAPEPRSLPENRPIAEPKHTPLQLDNKPFNPDPPRVDKSFVPDAAKLEEIRKTIVEPEPAKINLEPELTEGLDKEGIIDLNKIINNTESSQNEPDYTYEESAEIKIRKYVELYPNLKPITSSPDFKSSTEKLAYIEHYLNSTRMNANVTNWLFMATTALERNDKVNEYIKLKGYTRALNTRKHEIETYIEELKIKYMDEVGSMLEMPVEARLGLVFAEVALSVHISNSGAQPVQPPARPPPPPPTSGPPTMN